MVGKVVIQDNSLSFDNEYYFTIQTPVKTKVTIIGDVVKNKFIHRICTKEDFELNWEVTADKSWHKRFLVQ